MVRRIMKFLKFRSRLEKAYSRLEVIGYSLFIESMRKSTAEFERRSRNYTKTLKKLDALDKKRWF